MGLTLLVLEENDRRWLESMWIAERELTTGRNGLSLLLGLRQQRVLLGLPFNMSIEPNDTTLKEQHTYKAPIILQYPASAR